MARRSVLLDHLDIVGTRSDKEIAEQFGLTIGAVANFRRRRGIPPKWRKKAAQPKRAASAKTPEPSAPRKPKSKKRTRKRRSKLDPFRKLLGKVRDQELAEKAGVTVSAVQARRYKLGIKLDSKAIKASAAEAPPQKPKRPRKKRRSKLSKFRKVLGTVPDQQVAEQAGVKLSTVRQYRYAKGIKLNLQGAQKAAKASSATTRKPSAAKKRATRKPKGASKWAYRVDVRVGDNTKNYTVIAADIVMAGKLSLDGLQARGLEATVTSISLANEAL